MRTEAPDVHATRPVERAFWSAKQAVKRAGLEDPARTGVTRAARVWYRFTLGAVPNREELPFLLNARRLLGTAVEVGVARARFSEHVLTHWRGRRLISVDPWLEAPPGDYVDTCNTPQETQEDNFELTRQALERFGARSEVWRLTGDEAAELLQPATLDFIYIDARHDYDSVLSDLRTWYPRMRPGAIMAGHDYNEGVFAQGIHGVRPAVDEFFGSHGIRVHHTYADVPHISWLVAVPL